MSKQHCVSCMFAMFENSRMCFKSFRKSALNLTGNLLVNTDSMSVAQAIPNIHPTKLLDALKFGFS